MRRETSRFEDLLLKKLVFFLLYIFFFACLCEIYGQSLQVDNEHILYITRIYTIYENYIWKAVKEQVSLNHFLLAEKSNYQLKLYEFIQIKIRHKELTLGNEFQLTQS